MGSLSKQYQRANNNCKQQRALHCPVPPSRTTLAAMLCPLLNELLGQFKVTVQFFQGSCLPERQVVQVTPPGLYDCIVVLPGRLQCRAEVAVARPGRSLTSSAAKGHRLATTAPSEARGGITYLQQVCRLQPELLFMALGQNVDQAPFTINELQYSSMQAVVFSTAQPMYVDEAAHMEVC
mmetsp:Transcript_120351/g.239524  ORF Transcript_120351/g.239524 Transcript_120351/m.239524 type:complete len:180 (-) Transcript_120351:243-782(-)